MAVPESKKRYFLALDKNNTEELKAIIKSMRLPASTIGTICDEAIARTLHMFKLAQSKGNLTLADLLKMIGEQLDEVQKEEKARKTRSRNTKG